MNLPTLFPPQTAAQKVPRFFGFGYAGSCQSALEVGGDFYDVVPLSDSSLLLVMADVMGKGHPAALFAGSLRTLVRALAGPGLCPAQCLQELNELMFDELSSEDMFITLQLVVADLHRRQLQVANAGHCPLLVSDSYHRTEAIAPEGMPLGIDRNAAFTSETLALEPFASVLLYTDGVTEARDPAGRFFGQPRLEGWLRQALEAKPTALQLKRSLLQEVVTFQGRDTAADDQTFLILADETPRSKAASSRDNLGWVLDWNYPGLAAAQLNNRS